METGSSKELKKRLYKISLLLVFIPILLLELILLGLIGVCVIDITLLLPYVTNIVTLAIAVFIMVLGVVYTTKQL